MSDVLVIGTGLIGTSLGLALRERHDVTLSDESELTLQRAVQRGAGRRWDGAERAAIVVVCTPPKVIATTLASLIQLDIGSTYSHVASVQALVQADIEAQGIKVSALCGGHPLAGRERGGPDAASAQLFTGRTWAICPSSGTDAHAVAAVRSLAEAAGAHPLVLEAEAHDHAVALVSHLPQVAASALAARLVDGPELVGRLAGPGLQDSTRVAASDPELWAEILGLNARHVAPMVAELAEDLRAVAEALSALTGVTALPGVTEQAPPAAVGPGGEAAGPPAGAAGAAAARVADLLRRGAAGRQRVPVKRGERDADFVVVAVSVLDAPGQLASLLTAAGVGGVNVEDVRVEHAPDSPRGVIELLVRPAARDGAVDVLRRAGWDVLGTSG